MINLPGCIVLLPGVVNIFQIRKILRFDKSDRFDHSVLIEIKVVRNDILNNLYLHDKLPILHCSLREPPNLTKLINFMLF